MSGPDDPTPPVPPKPPAAPDAGAPPTTWPDDALDPDYPDVEGAVLEDETLAFATARTVSVLRSRVTGGSIGADSEVPVDLCDCILEGVDLAGLRIQGLTRVELRRCRLTGVELGDATIRDATFDDCALDLCGMREAQLERVVVQGGRADGLDLSGAKLTDVVVADLRIAEWTTTGIWCVRVDVSDADVMGVEDLSVLRGCTITSEQAMSLSVRLAKGLGLHVK